MSSHTFATAIEVVPSASVLLRGTVLIVHGVTATVLATCAWTYPWLWLLLPALLAHLGWSYQRYGCLRGRHVVRRLIWRHDGSWSVADAGGDMKEARLLPQSFLHPALLVLNFRCLEDGALRAVILCRDSESEAVLRRLRRRLRFQAVGA